MSARKTWLWALAALLLFSVVMVHQSRPPQLEDGLSPILPNLKARSVESVQVRPPGPSKLEIRAERTNDVWWLTEPLIYQGQTSSIESLLLALERLTPAAFIPPAELRSRPNADEDYGFSSPQAGSIVLSYKGHRSHLLIGIRTAPGDQVFLQVVGREGVYVVDAELLKLIPRGADDWRSTGFFGLKPGTFNRLTVTNGNKVFELQRESVNTLWRMTRPYQARAAHAKIEQGLEQLNAIQVQSFASDAGNPDLEPYGLLQPDLELAFSLGSNSVALLQFGKSPTNNAALVYARRVGQGGIVTVPKQATESWRASVYDFRDPHLVAVTLPVNVVEVQGEENFSIELNTNGWSILQASVPADPALIEDFLLALGSIRIAQFIKDAVIETDLPGYGLAPPARKYVLKSKPDLASVADAKCKVLAEVTFGTPTNSADKVFARRTEESFVYAVSPSDFGRLPWASWQFRDRKLWKFSETNVASLVIAQSGRLRQILRKGPHDWALAKGSQGVVNDLAVEETVRAVLRSPALVWVARGEENRARYGFPENQHQLTFETQDGRKVSILFGGEAQSSNIFAGTVLEGQFYVFEFPWLVYRDVVTFLSAP